MAGSAQVFGTSSLRLVRIPEQEMTPCKFTAFVSTAAFARLVISEDQASSLNLSTSSGSTQLVPLSDEEKSDAVSLLEELLQKSSLSYIGVQDSLKDCSVIRDLLMEQIDGIVTGSVDGLCEAVWRTEEAVLGGDSPAVEKQSAIGRFVRSVVCWYDRASFTEIGRLWEALRSYVSVDDEQMDNVKVSAVRGGIPGSHDVLRSRTEVNRILLQMISDLKGAKCEPSDDVMRRLENIRVRFPDEPLMRVVDCHMAIRSKNCFNAMRAVRDYFDEAGDPNMANPSTVNRFGALCMTRIARIFGCANLANNCLSEAIRLCREEDDAKSMHEALYEAFLLECLNEAGGRDVRESMIRKAIEDAAKEEMTEMQDVCNLALAKMKIEYYDDPKGIMSDLQNYSSSASGVDAGAGERKLHWKHANSVCKALMSSLYLRIGDIENSKLCAEEIVEVEEAHGPSHTQAVCNLALCCFTQGELDECLQHIESVTDSGDERVLVTSSIIRFQMALLSGKVEECGDCCRKLATIDKCESILRNAELLLHTGEQSAAVQKLNMILTKLSDKFLRTRCLLLVSQAYLMIRNTGACLHFLQEAHHIASSSHIGSALVDCKLTMAKLKIDMNLEDEAVFLLDSISPISKWDEARMAFLRAYLVLSRISSLNDKKDSSDIRTMRIEAVSQLNKSKLGFQCFGAFYHLRDVEYLTSVIYDQLGTTEERNESARRFNELNRDYPGNPTAGLAAL